MNKPTEKIADIIAAQVQSVCDWDDRTSPDDYPDHLLITADELKMLFENVTEAALSAALAVEAGTEPRAWFVKDYADGWIHFDNEADAMAYRAMSGSALLVAYSLDALTASPAELEAPRYFFDSEGLQIIRATTAEELELIELNGGCYELTGDIVAEWVKRASEGMPANPSDERRA